MGEIFRDTHARKYYFFSNEGNEPPHIHVRQAERSAKFWMETPLRLEYASKFSVKELREIERIIELNRELIIEKWNENTKLSRR
jgi:hypothetical protein